MRPGDILKGDLARHLRECGWLAFTEIEIPGTRDDPGSWHGRVDVVAVFPHRYARRDLRAYEVKVTRADFLRDVGTEKWRRYREVFQRVFFAVPAGLISKAEVPAEAGLITRGDNGWSVAKAAQSHVPPKLCVDSVLALLFRGYEQDRQLRNLRDRLIYKDGVVVDAVNFGLMTRRKLSQKKSELEPALRVLKDVMERALGETLDSGWDVEQMTERLSRVFETLAAFDEHRKAMNVIATYLRLLGSQYASADDQDEARQGLLGSLP